MGSCPLPGRVAWHQAREQGSGVFPQVLSRPGVRTCVLELTLAPGCVLQPPDLPQASRTVVVQHQAPSPASPAEGWREQESAQPPHLEKGFHSN